MVKLSSPGFCSFQLGRKCFFPTLPVSHLANTHDTDSKLLVALHFLDKEEQEELMETAQPRMMEEERRRREGEPGEAMLPTTGVDQESTFTSVAMKVLHLFNSSFTSSYAR